MKKGFTFFALIAAFFGLILSSCASTEKVLTPGAIDNDLTTIDKAGKIIPGVERLSKCQFYISKDVTLHFLSDERKTEFGYSGTVKAKRTIIRRTIKIESSTPGILQIKNKAGKELGGYSSDFSTGREHLILQILFDKGNDNVIQFAAFYDDKKQTFGLIGNEANYGGLKYSITYDGDERPYLLYKLVERTKEKTEERKVKGRKVGS
ncbi:MAG: hypothetical protein LBH43_17580 [Treponema sp.]|jgi:hypothetical protein|nr:hypothetical protein [Treponema sp.]